MDADPMDYMMDGDEPVDDDFTEMMGSLSLFTESSELGIIDTPVYWDSLFTIGDYLLAMTSLMKFSAKCLGISTNVMLDCGASREYVDKLFCIKNGLHMTTLPTAFSVSLANGEKLVCSHYVKNCKTQFKQFSHVCDLYVLDLNGEHEVIFGQTFLQKRNPIIDWVEQTMELRKRHKISTDDSSATVQCVTVMTANNHHNASPDKTTKDRPRNELFDDDVLSLLTQMEAGHDTSQLVGDHYNTYGEDYNDAFLSYKQFRRAARKKQPKDAVSGCIWVSISDDAQLNIAMDAQGKESRKFEFSAEEKKALEDELRTKHHDVLKPYPPAGVPPVRFPGAELKLEDGDPRYPPAKKAVRLNESQLFELRLQLQYYIEQGFIRPTDSAYATPVFFVPKPHTKPVKWRMACDYRLLNAITRRDAYPLPAVEQVIDVLKGATVYSKLDLSQYFHQIPVAKDSIRKTAITTRYGNFEWLVVPFGIHNAPAIAQRVANVIFRDFLDIFVIISLVW